MIGVALTALIVLTDDFSLFGQWQNELSDPLDYAWMIGSALLLLCLVPVWQIAGLWRAADHHIGHVGTILAGRATQMLATLMMILSITRFMGFIDTAAEYTPAMLAVGAYHAELVILPTGRELELRGGLGVGIATRVADVLAHNPGVRRIRLDSTTGLPDEARKLAAVISRNALNTYVTRRCIGVCVVPYLAGQHRYLRRDALLVFTHDGGLPESERDYLRERNISASFLKTWRVLGARGWRPGEPDLRSAHVVDTLLGNR